MSSRPCRFDGSWTALGNDLATSWIASLARLSDAGFFPTKIACGDRPSGILAQNDSIAWLNASMPECAVTCGGQETTSEGSTTAHLGMMWGVAIPTFINRLGS